MIEYSFEAFISTRSAWPALKACRAVAQGQGVGASRILVLCGPTGVGKTHLLHAVARAFGDTDSRVWNTTARHVVERIVDAIRRDQLNRLEQAPRGACVLVDDLHDLADKPGMQHTLAGTLTRWAEAGVTVLTAATSPPDAIELVARTLPRAPFSRTIAIAAPHLPECMRIVRAMFERRGLRSSNADIRGVALRCGGDIRRIVGAVNMAAVKAGLRSSHEGHAWLAETANCAVD